MDSRHRRMATLSPFPLAAVLFLALVSAPAEAACPPGLELGPYGLDAGPGVADVAVGDFDGDAIDDVAFVRDDIPYVIFGTPDDRPNQPVGLPHTTPVYEIAAMPDHDGDGRDELAIGRDVPGGAGTWTIEVFRAGANRQFSVIGSIPTVRYDMRDLMAEDFDGDGDVDLAMRFNQGGFLMLEQSGSWAFAPVAVPGLDDGFGCRGLQMGDFDGNGRNDLVALETAGPTFRLAVFPASGMDATVVATGTPTAVHQVAVADIDGDGRDDVVLSANQSASHGGFAKTEPGGASMNDHIDPFVHVYKVVGTTATLQASLPSGFSVTMSGAGDIDHDGFVDILHAYAVDPHLSWFRGTGGFNFAPVTPMTGSSRAASIAWGDIDRDGLEDAIVGGGPLAVGVAGFLSGQPFLSALDCAATPAGPEEVVLADLDGDGDRDFAVLATLDATIARYFGDGSGTSWSRVDLPIEGSARDLVAIDCDSDGAVDLLTVHTAPARLIVRRGDGAGGYLSPVEYLVPDGPLRTLPADLDDDGDLDLVVLANTPSPSRVFRGDGAGGFVSVADIPVGFGITDALLKDVDGDALPDLAFCQALGGVWLARGVQGAEFFAPPISLDLAGTQVEALDANQDGRLDLAAAGSGPYGRLRLGEAGGGFSEAIPFLTGLGTRELRAGDFDGDGLHDLIVAAQPIEVATATGSLHFLRGAGDGSFAPAGARGVGRSPTNFALGDVTGDQRPDIVVSQRDDQEVLVAANIFAGTVSVPAVPRSSALFARVSPSPSFGPFGVELTGRPEASVDVQLYDVAGRRIGTPRETRLGADGRGRLAMDTGGRPGVYFVRVVQGADVHVTRAVVLP